MQQSSSAPIAITLAKGTVAEQQTREQLLDLLPRYPLDKWRYTEQVRIEEGVIPHSHPILTLNTQYLRDTDHLLTDYIHEQLHWFTLLEGKSQATGRAIEAFRQMYSDLPVKRPEGCGSEFSNYLHVLVCYLEYLGLGELLGADRAREVVGQKRYYTRVYQLALNETARIGEVVRRSDALPAPRPPERKVFRHVD